MAIAFGWPQTKPLHPTPTHPNPTQPDPTHSNPTHPNPPQAKPSQDKPSQAKPTQHNTTQLNPAQPNRSNVLWAPSIFCLFLSCTAFMEKPQEGQFLLIFPQRLTFWWLRGKKPKKPGAVSAMPALLLDETRAKLICIWSSSLGGCCYCRMVEMR